MNGNPLLSNNPLYIVDVGARDGMHSRWNKFTSSYKGILFEPDPNKKSFCKLLFIPPKNCSVLQILRHGDRTL